MYRINQVINIPIVLQEPNFDRACEAAIGLMFAKLGFSTDGYFTNVEDFNRSTDSLEVNFVKYRATVGMNGQSHQYAFVCRIRRDGVSNG